MSKELSDGQVKLWNFLEDFLRENDLSEILSSRELQSNAWKVVKDFISINEELKEDPFLSSPRSEYHFSRPYMKYLMKNSTAQSFNKDEINFPICFRYFDYNYSDSSDDPIYNLGGKSDTTIKAMLTIVSNERFDTNYEIPHWDWDVNYIQDNKYSTIYGGGNHRSLAHRILGYEHAKPSQIYIYKNVGYSEQINEAFKLVFPYFDFEALDICIESNRDTDIIVKLSRLKSEDLSIISMYMNGKVSRFSNWGLQEKNLLSESDIPKLIAISKTLSEISDKPKYLQWIFEALKVKDFPKDLHKLYFEFKEFYINNH